MNKVKIYSLINKYFFNKPNIKTQQWQLTLKSIIHHIKLMLFININFYGVVCIFCTCFYNYMRVLSLWLYDYFICVLSK